VDLAGQAAPGTSEPVVGRLDDDPAGRFLLEIPLRRPSRMLVGPADRGVDVHVPGDQALGIRLGLHLSDDPGPGAIALPAPEQVIDPVHGP
jgi:hypothetical protein